nr:hypothetical protein BaRGS_009232 [Batillaria attramentaria]
MELHFGFTLIGDFITGLSGGSIGMSTASYALVSDTHGRKRQGQDSHPENTKEKNPEPPGQSSASDEIDLDMSREKSRSFKLVLLHIVPYLAGSIVSFVEGYIIAYLGFFWSLIIVIGFKSFFFIFAIVFVTETGQQKKAIEFTGPLK